MLYPGEPCHARIFTAWISHLPGVTDMCHVHFQRLEIAFAEGPAGVPGG